MIKNFEEMRKIDITPYVEQRDGYDYLNWAKCKELLHQNGAEVVYFEPCVNENGSSLFMSDVTFTDSKGNTNRCYEVRVKIKIDDLEFYAQHPVMNGCNPVKDNSMSQQRVWNSQTRAFTKGVAMRTGLGFDLWLKDMESNSQEDDLSKHSIRAIEERTQKAYTQLIKKGMTTREIAQALNKTEDEVRVLFTFFAQIDRLEQELIRLMAI